MDYSTYETTDFIFDDWFVAWVTNPTPESNAFWERWQLEHPDRTQILQEARFWVLNVGVKEQFPTEQEIEADIQRVQQRLAGESETEGSVIPLFGYWAWRVAAVIGLLLGIGWYVQRSEPDTQKIATVSKNTDSPSQLVRENNSAKPLDFKLPDGSSVVLAPKSKLSYPKVFALASRQIELKGEASFDVVHRPKQPFIVHTGKVNVRVLGTSFVVKAYDNAKDINVAVKSGKVAVSKSFRKPGRRAEDVLLTPNQQVSFSLRDYVFRKSLVEAPILIDKESREEDFVFEDAAVEHVFQKLEKAYRIDIVYSPEIVANCTLNARLSNEPLYQKLDMICQAIGATHETVGTQIIIHSEGCN